MLDDIFNKVEVSNAMFGQEEAPQASQSVQVSSQHILWLTPHIQFLMRPASFQTH